MVLVVMILKNLVTFSSNNIFSKINKILMY